MQSKTSILDATRTWVNRWEVAPTRPTSYWRHLSAPQLFALSFLLLILLGAIGLKTLPGLYTGSELSWIDAVFTSTSAVCVTGLIVVDTATYFTFWGQAFLLLLIQLGGLGMITFSTLLILALRRRLSLRHQTLSTGMAEVAPHVDSTRLARDIIRFTFLLEAAGAVILYVFWVPRFGAGGAVWHAVFHSVSAFCNAGFSTFSDSLMSFQRAPLSLLTIMILIVAGGLGFLTLEELYLQRKARATAARFRLSVHSRMVLTTTAILLAGGWALLTFFEWRVTLGELPVWARVVNGLFMSVTARTAGFNSIDYAHTEPSTSFLTILLMAIGGSPGSTAGGLKTTTIALLVLLAWSRFRGEDFANAWGRSIPDETVQRAIGLFVVGFVVLTAGIFALITFEQHGVPLDVQQHSFLSHMFEAASAFNTVGLSMGLTAETGVLSRCTTILLMYMGRVGPLTFAAALVLVRAQDTGKFRYAYEDVIVG